MCGIAGILYADAQRVVEPATLRAMTDAIAHRGPDAAGHWIGDRDDTGRGIGLGHRRLSIIDLAGGDQPLGNEDNSIQVVFNGEIYNFPQLRPQLEARGHRFRTSSDTEVLVHLYEDHGERLVEHLRGMFAFALWDTRRRQLLLARDRLGLKPLYIYRDAEKLLFGSELKAILAHPQVERSVDPQALEDYLCYGFVPGEQSIFRRIRKLPAGGTLLLSGGQLDAVPRRYWQYSPQVDSSLTTDQWLETVRAKVDESVQAHLLADVPVGAFLSGGVDSSVIVEVMARQAGRGFKTFSIGFQEEQFSELPFAREVAEHFGCQPIEQVVTPSAAECLDDLVRFYDEPFADSSAIPSMYVARLAAEHVKVVLSGDGGDEAFGGYARYAHDLREARWRAAIPGWIRRLVLANAARVWPKADWLPRALRAKTRLTNLSLDPAAAYANTVSACRLPLRRRLLCRQLITALNGHRPEAMIAHEFRRATGGDALAGMITADVGVLLPDDFLTKVDRASMGYGLEVRPPLVDHELIELSARIPSDLKVRGSDTKWIFKEAYRHRLPATVTTRAKRGFEIPVDDWLRGPLRHMFEGSVLDGQSPVAELIDQRQVAQLYQSHRARVGRHGNVLWSLLILARWAETYLQAPAGQNA